jgi:hypothetical protein
MSFTRSDMALGEPEQALPDQRFDAGLGAGRQRELGERAPDFTFAEALVTERLKGLGRRVGMDDRERPAVDATVGVPKSQALADRAFDDQRPSMYRPMVGATPSARATRWCKST